ncbi:MAG: Sensor histidine kinase YycG [Firmicutes bacterium ADurb.Bin146]|nr:MAG: Sensor histidine kinase YycG [Firmicutes bacterium ADurb.Bin146]
MVFYICIIAVCMIIPIGVLMNNNVEQYHYTQFIRNIENGKKMLSYVQGEPLNIYTVYTDMRDLYASSFGIYGNNRSFTIVDRNTNEIYSNDSVFLSGDGTSFINELFLSYNFLSSMAGAPLNSEILQNIKGRTFYDYSMTLENLVIYFRYYKVDWQDMVTQFNETLLSALLFSIIVAFIVGYLLSKAITKPIKDMTVRTKDISEGEFGRTLDIKADDEIGQLSSSINNMSYSLKNMLDEISSEKNKMEIILDNIEGGVIAFNLNGEMIHNNPAAYMLLNRSDMDFTLESFVKEYDIDIDASNIPADLYKETILSIDDEMLALSIASFKDSLGKAEGVILLFRNITKQYRLDQMRKEFVANVSHELKTPLTSIKSFTEALMGGVEDPATANHFLEVINSESDRMNILVKDLLQLSSMDMGRMVLKISHNNVSTLISDALLAVEAEASQKKHTIVSEITYKGIAYFDYDRMLQCVINLLVNAIKYTDQSGKIEIKSYEEADKLCIAVKDNGIGISKKDQERIFERFYRVDKARTRTMGGTGLGLAIASEIVKAHNGDIKVESKVNQGTMITIRIPLIQKEGVQ